MPTPCTPTGRIRWDGDWDYHAAAPHRVVSSDHPGGGSVAMSALHVWKRPFSREFTCCDGDAAIVVWVPGNWAVFIQEQFDVGQTVLTAPLADQVLGLIFGSPPTSVWGTAEIRRAIEANRPEGPDEDSDGNGQPEYAGEPTADCGEFVYMPDERRIPWAELGDSTGGDDGHDGDDSDPVPVPGGWAPAGSLPDCCDPLDRLARRPTFEIVGEPRFRKDSADDWHVSCHVRVSHPCGLDMGSKIVQYWLEYPPAPNPLGGVLPSQRLDLSQTDPPLFTTSPSGSGPATNGAPTRLDIEWTNAQTPNPTSEGARFRIRIRIASLCRETLDVVYSFADNAAPGGVGSTKPGCLPFFWPRRRSR